MTDLFATNESVVLVDLVARATILLSVSLALQWLTRRGPAATRHHLWTLTFALLLVVPGLRLFGPSWEVPLLPQAGRPSEEPGSEALEHGASVVSAAGTLVPVAADAPEARGRVEAPAPGRLTQLAFVLWAIGCAASFASLGVGAFRFHRRVRAAQPVENEAWLEHLDALRKQLTIRTDVRLVLGTESVTPMTGGLRRPVILLPASAEEWSEARRHVVLAHELVHVCRRDALRQLVGRAVLSFYWFHPLSWVASHLAAARREEACDEEVLAAGARPSDYAGHLLSVAESRSLGRPVLSLPMAQRSQLERRIRAILKPGRARPRALVTAVALTAVTAAGITAAVANPIRPRSAPDTLSDVAAVMSALVECATASDADRLSGRVFAQGDGLFLCTIDEDAVANASGGLRAIGPREWAVLESEIRRQIAQLDADGSVRTRKAKAPQPARESWAGETLHTVKAEVESRHGLSPR